MSSYTNNRSFEESVATFSHENVNGNPDADKRALIPSLVIRSVIIALCIGLFGYAIFMLASNALETNAANDFYDSIRADANASVVKPSPSLLEPASLLTMKEMLNADGEAKTYVLGDDPVQDPQRRSSIYRNFVNKTAKYPDMYGWIYVNHTKIDYPIMKGSYTNYYMNHDINGNPSANGSITAESSLSDVYAENLNTVLYGHCMKNGMMFRTLKTFMESANRNTLAKDMSIEVYTKEGLYIYKVLSGYRNDDNAYAETEFDSPEEYKAFLDLAVSRNELRVSSGYSAESAIVTLITCANVTSNEDERYVLHGILTTFIPANQL